MPKVDPKTEQSLDYRAIFESMPGSFLILQPNPPIFTILDANDELLRLSGKAKLEIVGRGLFEIFPDNPDDSVSSGPDSLRNSLRMALDKKAPDYLPVLRYDVLNAQGTFEERYWKAGNTPILNELGKVSYIIHSTEEVTEQVLADREYADQKLRDAAELMQQVPLAISIVKGPENKIEMANEQMLQLWGKDRRIIGSPFLKAIPEAANQGLEQMLHKVRLEGETYQASEFPLKCLREGHGEERYFTITFQPYYEHSTDKAASGVFTLAYDVTEQVRSRNQSKDK